MPWTKRLVAGFLVFILSGHTVRAQGIEENTVDAASEVLREIMAIPASSIPEALLAEAHGVAIIPGMVKGAFVVGLRHGKGVIVTRDASGAWRSPVFITVTGGSVGWQAGLESTDVIAVFRNRRGVEGLMRGRLTLGADAEVAAGPVGRQASAATDGMLKAEILSYSRSRGLFAGVAIDGAALLINHRANAAYYAPRPGQPRDAVPASALKLVEQIAAYAGPKNKVAINLNEAPILTVAPPTEDVEALSAQLAVSSLRLQRVLDRQWQEYLMLPADVFAEGRRPSLDAVEKCLSRYGAVTNDPRYRELSGRPEFQETQALLLRYRIALQGSPGTLKLPPPPR